MHAQPNIAISFAGVLLLAAVVFVGAKVLSGVVGHVRGRRNHSARQRPRSEFAAGMAALFTTAAICALLILLFVGSKRFGSTRGSSSVRVERSGNSQITVTRQITGQTAPRVTPPPVPGVSEEPMPPPRDGAGQNLAELSDQSDEKAAATEIRLQTPDGKVVVVSLPADIVEQLSADNRTRVLEALSETVPAGLRRAYALVPLPSPVSDPVAGGVQQVLTLNRLEALVQAVSSVWGDPLAADSVAGSVDDTSRLLAEMDDHAEPPAWIENPGHGRIVVKTDFVDASEPAARILQPVLCSALMQSAENSVRRQTSLDDSAAELVRLKLSDEAVRKSVKETYAQTQVINTRAEGPKVLRKTYALVEFPDSVLNEASASLRTGVQRNRTRALGLALGAAWLTIVVLSFAIRAGHSRSTLLRLAGTPALGLLMLPCALATAGIVIAMTQGEIPVLQVKPTIHVIDTTP